MSVIYDRVALIGLGLIAGSMAHAIREKGLAREVVGYARSSETRDIARDIGLCDRIADSATDAVTDADLIVLAVPSATLTVLPPTFTSKSLPLAARRTPRPSLSVSSKERAPRLFTSVPLIVDDALLATSPRSAAAWPSPRS